MQQIQTVLQHDGLNHLALADRQELSAEADRQRGLADEAKTSAERSAKHRFASLWMVPTLCGCNRLRWLRVGVCLWQLSVGRLPFTDPSP